MPTYEYRCESCGHEFEKHQTMEEAALSKCPECHGSVRRVISGGAGFIIKGGHGRIGSSANGCSLETSGRTCCGHKERCGKPPCG